MRRLALLLALAPSVAQADTPLPPQPLAYTQLADPAQEARAKALMETLRCVVCQGQSIADSDADMAGSMRALVRSRIAAGESPASIRAWLIQRYGAYVSYDPPLSALTWPLWAAPLVLLAAGGVAGAGQHQAPHDGRAALMGWVMLVLLGGGAMAALVLLRLARPLWSLVGAGLMLGGAGYALQGSPALPASPATPMAQGTADDPELIALRDQMLGRYTADDAYLVAADAIARSGDRHAAASLLLAGLHSLPRSVTLWTAFGSALAAQDGNTVSPPALFAFQQAMRLSSRHPAPPFFLGMAYVRAGDFAAAQAAWRRALVLSPIGAPYRAGIAERLVLLDRYLATVGR